MGNFNNVEQEARGAHEAGERLGEATEALGVGRTPRAQRATGVARLVEAARVGGAVSHGSPPFQDRYGTRPTRTTDRLRRTDLQIPIGDLSLTRCLS